MARYLKKMIRIIFMIFFSIYLKVLKNVIVSVTARISRNTSFEGGNKINCNVSISDTHIGYGTFIGDNTFLDKVKIGRFCSIASNVKVIAASHPIRTFVSTHPAFYSLLKQSGFAYTQRQIFEEYMYYNKDFYLLIENDVWIGTDVVLMGGLKIGNGSVILAGSVVTKDVAPYSIVGGVPAKIVRYRFSKNQIERLLMIKWWDWDVCKIKNTYSMFEDIDKFLTDTSILSTNSPEETMRMEK